MVDITRRWLGEQERHVSFWFGALPERLVTLEGAFAPSAKEMYQKRREHDGYHAPRYAQRLMLGGMPAWPWVAAGMIEVNTGLPQLPVSAKRGYLGWWMGLAAWAPIAFLFLKVQRPCPDRYPRAPQRFRSASRRKL